ncbi:MAG: zinc-binding dehydrogenase [Phycisphaerae bacterium]
MKAAAIEKHGDIDVIELKTVDDPTPAADEVVVDIRAAALNHLDIWVRKGGRMEIPFPHVLGSDGAGRITAVGENVENRSAGDEVIINAALSCDRCEFCRRGQHSLCENFGLIGFMRWGTFAEKAAVPARNVFPKPCHLNWAEAAALPLAHVTAWRMLMTRLKIGPEQTVLIHGIGGGVALAGLQIAKAAGARVIVTSSDNEKLAAAEERGADFGINYTKQDIDEAVGDYTAGRGVDAILDSVGSATWETNFKVLRRGGAVAHCGITTGAEATVSIQQLYWNQFTVMGSTMGSDEDFRQMISAAENNDIKPVIDSTFPLEKIRDATARMEQGKQFGKIVLTVD